MSTQNRNSGGGGRNQKKSNTGSGGIASGGGGGGGDTATHTASKKSSDTTKTEKEKVQPKPTPEQLRIAQITNSNAAEDPQMREKVATLIEMTQRSEEEVCCALYECDNNLERAVVFLLETLPVGAFETSSKKKKKQAVTVGQENAVGDGDGWHDANITLGDKREKSRNRSSNRGGRGGTDSRGWRGREARENERNLRESRGGDRDRGGERDDRTNNERGGPRGRDGNTRSGGGSGIGRGGGYAGRTGRGGGRMGGRTGTGRGERSTGSGGYNSRQNNTLDDHQEVELWDNTIAQNAEKHTLVQDDAWGDWDNEEYVGSLKDSKVFTTSNLPNQTAASVVSGGLSVGTGVGVGVGCNTELGAPPGLEPPLQQTSSHLDDGNTVSVVQSPSTPMQYSAALAGTPLQQATQTPVQQTPPPQQTLVQSPSSNVTSSGLNVNAPQYNSVVADSFTNAANAAASLVQQVQAQQQAQTQLKASATLSAEQSQYFNSLTSQNVVVNSSGVVTPQQQQQQQPQPQQTPPINTYAQSAANTPNAVQYTATYANVFGTGATANNTANVGVGVGMEHQQPPVQQVRRPRTKLPPPSKIPSTAVEMPGDSLNNMTYLDVQFGGLDFGTDDSFDALSDKFNSSVTIDNQTQQAQQLGQDVNNDYQNKTGVQQPTALTAGLQNAQIGDSLSGGYATQRPPVVGQQQQVVGGSPANVGNTSLEHLTKNDHVYNQANVNNTGAYQTYQPSGTNKVAGNTYQQSAAVYSSNAYGNVQASVASAYQAQGYGTYQQNAVNSYQQQASNVVPGAVNNGNVNSNSTQNIPVGGTNANSANSINSSNSNTGYLSAGYPTQPSAYQTSQSVYGGTGLSNSSGYAGSSNSTSQYSNFSTSAKLKDTTSTSSTSHFESVATNNNNNVSGSVSSSNTGVNAASGSNTNTVVNSASAVTSGSANAGSSQSSGNNNGTGSNANNTSSNVNNNATSVMGAVSGASSAVVAAANKNSAAAGASAGGSGGMVPNIQMVSQYIQTGLPYYQQPVYSYEELQMMQQRVPHVQGYYDLNYTPTSLGAGRDNLGSVAYSTMTDGRFARTDNNSSPVSNVSSTMSQQAGSSGPMLNVPYYFYGGNVMPGSFQYGTPAIYSQQIPAPNTASGGQFPKPSYNTGYGSTSYDALTQGTQDYSKGGYPSSVNQPTKPQNVSNQPPAGTGSDITTSMYGKGHVTLNKVNSYEKQNFHSGTPPPFNMPNTQTAGGTSAQPYGMYLPMPAAAGHHNMIHQPIHQDSNSSGQRQQSNSQSKSANKQGYSPSYWTGQN